MADTRKWHFVHNNEPAVVLDVPESVRRPADVITLGLQQIGKPESPHPCRAWPVKEPKE